jgi:pimeloyl-ACP methyl ester carboxylesterase
LSSVESADTAATPESAPSAGASETECCGGIGDPRMDCDSPLSAHLKGSGEGREGCPTPLAWQQVLAGVGEQSVPWSIPFSHGRIGGIEFGQGPPLYFLNTAGGDHRLWMLFCWLFREERTCILFDDPAWNKTPSPARWLDSMADAVLAVADHRGDSTFELYASGFGGLTALSLMHRAPGRVRRGVLQGAFSHRNWSLAERLLSTLGRITPGRVSHLPGWQAIQEQNHRICFPPYDPTRWEFLRDNLASTTIQSASLKMAVAARGIAADVLASIKTPLLLIRCEGDGAALSQLEEEMASALPHAQVEWMHTSGHFPHVTHPHRLAKVVRPFLTQA